VLSCQTQDCSVVICQCQGRTSTSRWWIVLIGNHLNGDKEHNQISVHLSPSYSLITVVHCYIISRYVHPESSSYLDMYIRSRYVHPEYIQSRQTTPSDSPHTPTPVSLLLYSSRPHLPPHCCFIGVSGVPPPLAVQRRCRL
jgi:hypothetical protein